MTKKNVHQGATSQIGAKKTAEWIFQFWAWQLLVWALYRYFLKLPEWVDEFIFKPLVFVLPVLLYVWFKEKQPLSSIGLTVKEHGKNIMIGLAIGVVFILEGMLANTLKYGVFTFRPIQSVTLYGIPFLFLFSFATAFSEELLCRGFFFSRLYEQSKRLWYAICFSTLMFMAFHIPILVTSLKFQGMTLLLFFWTSLFLGVVNSLFYHRTKSLVVPVLVHLFWNVTVALFL